MTGYHFRQKSSRGSCTFIPHCYYTICIIARHGARCSGWRAGYTSAVPAHHGLVGCIEGVDFCASDDLVRSCDHDQARLSCIYSVQLLRWRANRLHCASIYRNLSLIDLIDMIVARATKRPSIFGIAKKVDADHALGNTNEQQQQLNSGTPTPNKEVMFRRAKGIARTPPGAAPGPLYTQT